MLSEFSIKTFKPALYDSPLASIRFVSDGDTVLLDPSRYDASQEGSRESLIIEPQSTTSSQQDVSDPTSMQQVKLQLAGARRRLFFDPKTSVAAMVEF